MDTHLMQALGVQEREIPTEEPAALLATQRGKKLRFVTIHLLGLVLATDIVLPDSPTAKMEMAKLMKMGAIMNTI
jgi:hypothetical protein